MTVSEKRLYLKELLQGKVVLNIELLSNDEKLRLALILRNIRENTGHVVTDILTIKDYGLSGEDVAFIYQLIIKKKMI